MRNTPESSALDSAESLDDGAVAQGTKRFRRFCYNVMHGTTDFIGDSIPEIADDTGYLLGKTGNGILRGVWQSGRGLFNRPPPNTSA